MLETHLVGAFPRSERLVELTRAADRGKASATDLDAAYDRDTVALASLQKEAGLNFFVDGQLNWQDLFRPFLELFTGIRLGSLTRWFDNNTFYKTPIITEKTTFRGNNLNRYFRIDLLPTEGSMKAILPGPYTFAKMSENASGFSFKELVDNLAHSVKEAVFELRKLGYSNFQFNEPMLCFRDISSEQLTIAKDGYETCVKGIESRTLLHTYFGDAAPVIDSLLDFPVDCIGIDLYATSIESLAEYKFDREICCGCIDGRNSLLESSQDLSKTVGAIRNDLEPRAIIVGPNCDLDFLPYPVAEKKVQLLSQLRSLV